MPVYFGLYRQWRGHKHFEGISCHHLQSRSRGRMFLWHDSTHLFTTRCHTTHNAHTYHNCVNLALKLGQSQRQNPNRVASVKTVQIKRASILIRSQEIWVFRDMMLWQLATGSWFFKHNAFISRGVRMSIKTQALCTFKMARTTHIMTQCCSPENLNPHKQHNQNLKPHKTRPHFHLLFG